MLALFLSMKVFNNKWYDNSRFFAKKERKSFFKKQVDVDEKKWDQLVEGRKNF